MPFTGGASGAVDDLDQTHTPPTPHTPAPTQQPAHDATIFQPIALAAGMAPAPNAAAARWADYAQRCATIKGVVACCVFDLRSQLPLAQVGAPQPSAERLAIQGGLLMDGMANAGEALGVGERLPEASISFGQQHLLLRPVPGHAGVVLHLVLQASANNVTLARMQLERVAAPLLSSLV